jgi:hypothetical protein
MYENELHGSDIVYGAAATLNVDYPLVGQLDIYGVATGAC